MFVVLSSIPPNNNPTARLTHTHTQIPLSHLPHTNLYIQHREPD